MKYYQFAAVILVACFFIPACKERQPGNSTTANDTSDPGPPTGPSVELTFTYGSEKEEWVKDVTAGFNAARHKTPAGETIFVKAIPLGSGECIDTLLDESLKADITSPASAAFIKLGNAKSRAKTGKDLIPDTENLVLSPVVIAMWKPMAEALGWPEKALGWSDILSMAGSQEGWAGRGFPQWGKFKFGHTHPEFSNSGLISLLAEVYAATGKKAGLTLDDINAPETATYLSGIERSVVHYGSSTGFFGKKMFLNGPEFLSAAVLYENLVIESYSSKYHTSFPVVAIYPKEGTFWSDHPAGIVDRPWVTPEKREAAKLYLAHLLARPQQETALKFGFRPALPEIPLASPLDSAHGVDPLEPQTTLEVPDPEIMEATIRLWHANKKRSRITLVFDVSGSMKMDGKINSARLGALELLHKLGEGDSLSLMAFNHTILGNTAPVPLKTDRERLEQQISSLFADGGTSLYDAVGTAFNTQMASAASNPDQITAIVVLTDGADSHSKTKLNSLLEAIRSDEETRNIRVFTIGYGSDAQKDVLEKIAAATQAKYYKGTNENIREVFRDISTFF